MPALAADQVEFFDLPQGARPHDVGAAAGAEGGVHPPRPGGRRHHRTAAGPGGGGARGEGSAPHGVIPGPDGAAWITDGGQNAIVRFDPGSREVAVHPLPAETGYTNLNTAAFDGAGTLWFTGQNGIYGRLDPESGAVEVFDAPKGRGPYGITATPDGAIYYASLAGSHIARVDTKTGEATLIEPPTANQGARRVWADSNGDVWVSEWNSGQVSRYSPASGAWQSWQLPGAEPKAYAVYVDDQDVVWLSDFGANAVVRFDPESATFESFAGSAEGANVRQIHGRPGEVWAPESGTDRLMLIRTGRS